MKVFFTEAAEESLWPIYQYHCRYSPEHAEAFQREIDRYIRDTLGAQPLIGHVFHEARQIRRVVFQRRYNIYYTLRDEAAYVLFIFDGRMDINQLLQDNGVPVDPLIKG